MSPNDWEKVLLSLSDDTFFSIARNYLGEIKTPFNKHTIIKKLISFFSNPGILRIIAASLSDSDIKFLSAVYLLDGPSPEELLSFFEGERSYLDLYNHLLNLEERLLLYREKRQEGEKIELAPLISRNFKNQIMNLNLLFESKSPPESNTELPWLNDALLIGFASFAFGNPDMLKTDGSLKKKALTKLLAVFPILSRETAAGLRYEIILSVFNLCKLLIPFQWMEFSGMEKQYRQPLIYAGAEKNQDHDNIYSVFLHKGELIFRLLHHTSQKSLVTFQALQRIASYADREHRFTTGEQKQILQSLIETECFIPVSSDPGFYQKSAFPEGSGKCVLEASFELTLSQDIDLSAGSLIPLVADIESYDTASRYRISKDSITRAFRAGFTWDAIREKLQQLCSKPIPQNLDFSVKMWEQEFRSIRFIQGTICIVGKEKAHLFEHSPECRKYIKEIIAPGIFILDYNEKSEWSKAFINAGADVLPEIENYTQKDPDISIKNLFPPFSCGEQIPVYKRIKSQDHEERDNYRQQWKDLTAVLRNKCRQEIKDPEQQEEFLARIDKRLILTEKQLQSRGITGEKREAKGFDYIGKIRLIEQAIETGEYILDVIYRTTGGEPERYLVKPDQIEQKSGGLFLRGKELPAQKELKIPIKKISLVRMLKRSIFAP